MILWYSGGLILIAALCIGLQLLLKVRALGPATNAVPGLDTGIQGADRYRPMLRLLSDEDIAFLPPGSPLRPALRARRRELFRGYLRCLTRDYGRLLSGVRSAMVQSGVDRPDLARALAKNRVLFAIAICKVEYRLALHAAGIGRVEIGGLIGGLVDALETLRKQMSVLTPAAQLG